MPLSPHEQRALAAIEDALNAQDPSLAARFHGARVRPHRSTPSWLRWLSVPLVDVALLVLALAVLAIVHTVVPQAHPLLTAGLTLALAGGWVVLAARRTRRPEPAAPTPTGGSANLRI